ncbi:MAG: amidohydrolase family protein [Alphaproteobacteria bacterium]|nr:amidohydrolase family protein [Alphaproteobacteria bacterium]
MIRKLLFACLLATPALAETPVDQLAKPPADATVWSISSSNGAAHHGSISLWTDKDGTHWSRFSFNLRGFVSEIDEQNRFASDGTLTSLVVRGKTPQGDAAETYEVKDGTYSFTSPVDHGTGKVVPGLDYVSFGGTPDSFIFILNDMLKSPDKSVNLLPSGRGSIAPLTTLEVSNGTEKKTLTAYAVTGFGLSPFPVWFDGDKFFGTAGVIAFLPPAWEKVGADLSKAQDDALAKLAPALVASIAKPAGTVAFKNVELYDSAARKFLRGQTVVVADGRIAAVGAHAKIPAKAEVIDGTGKTLIPGLWDNHQHYGDDSTGPLLLASGITSVRDPGNQQDELLARKKRIDDGQLLGQRIVPSLLIDGPGPYTAQVAEVVHNQDEALAAVHKAKDKGYFGIKLYGSLDPAWVKPMADLAHQLGLHVHGHIPHGMRPLEAVHAGYDEITHINWVMMQAMPDDVVKNSNGMGRFEGTGKYAKDVDLHSPAMTAYLDELASRHIAVDPTLVTFEDLYVPDRGTYPPADAPYADTLPSQFARGFLSGSMAPTPELSRETMRASFAKLTDLVAELNRRHMSIVAGTDGVGFELVRELELYVEAGMSPEDALATATSTPAKLFKVWDKTGSLEKGKLAELALIDGDPSTHMGDLRQVELVMRDGKMMKASDLRAPLGISGAPKR